MCGCKRHHKSYGKCTCRCESHRHLWAYQPKHRGKPLAQEQPFPHGFQPRHCGCIDCVSRLVGGRA